MNEIKRESAGGFGGRMRSALPPVEVCVYFVAWLLTTTCSLCYLYKVQEEIFYNYTSSQLLDLKPGWIFLSRQRDDSDIEWTTWKYYFHKAWLPLLIHFAISEFLRNVKKAAVPYWYILFTINFMMIKFGLREMLLILSQPIIYILLLYSGAKKMMVWIVSIAILVAVNSESNREILQELMDQRSSQEEKIILIWIAMGWIQLRCMSFSFDYIDYNSSRKMKDDKNKKWNAPPPSLVSGLLSYSLYFPTLFMGPVILYSEFEQSFSRITSHSLSTRLTQFLKDITIFMVYACLKDLALHYIYFLAIQNDARYVRMLPSLALCGAGLWMGLQFYLKYVIMYGTAGAFASLDHIEPPPVPRCIARIHLYSHMWKYFDVGLYNFLREYIYKPSLALMTAERNATMVTKVSATFITFTFIYLWHGTMLPILIWSVLNYLGVLIERSGLIIKKTKLYAKFKTSILKTDQMEERFKAVISTPLLIMSALSNFYLFTDYWVGNMFVERFFSESWSSIAFIHLCLYTCCQVSSILSDVPSRTARKGNSN